jgi:hypothetical protein
MRSQSKVSDTFKIQAQLRNCRRCTRHPEIGQNAVGLARCVGSWGNRRPNRRHELELTLKHTKVSEKIFLFTASCSSSAPSDTAELGPPGPDLPRIHPHDKRKGNIKPLPSNSKNKIGEEGRGYSYLMCFPFREPRLYITWTKTRRKVRCNQFRKTVDFSVTCQHLADRSAKSTPADTVTVDRTTEKCEGFHNLGAGHSRALWNEIFKFKLQGRKLDATEWPMTHIEGCPHVGM